jgi:thermitase
MNIPIKAYSAVLASAFALVVVASTIGCGAPDTVLDGPVQPPVTPPSLSALPEPAVQYKFFEPATEEELKATYGDGERRGLAIANYGYMIAKTRADFPPEAFGRQGLRVLSSMSANGARYWYLQKGSDLVETMRKARKTPGLRYIEPEIMSYATASFAYSNPDSFVDSGRQYGVLTTLAKKAWEAYGFGPNRPVVANIDTGVRWAHEDFQRPDGTCVVTNAFSWYDASGRALLTDVGLMNPAGDPAPPDYMATNFESGGTDGGAHGSHTCGTMAAVGNNGKGAAGMCWDVDLVSYKGLSNGGGGGDWTIYGSLWHLAKWKNELVDGKPRYPHTIPVNMSLGAAYVVQFQCEMIELAMQHDLIVCAAAGNDRSGIPAWPGSLTGCVRVGGVNHLDRLDAVDGFSNWGPDISVVAPGIRVVSLSSGHDAEYAEMSGTSMAAPHVTGLIGYMLTFAPDLKPDQIKTYLEQNADPIEGQKGHNIRHGWGRINAYKTIGAVMADQAAGRTPPSNYVQAPLKVTVKDGGGNPADGALVWLYNCDQNGNITNFVSVTMAGPSYADMRDNPAAAAEMGTASFSMLRPGYYKVAATAYLVDLEGGGDISTVASSSMVEVRSGSTPTPVAITLPDEMLNVQTLAASNPNRAGTATSIDFYTGVTGPPAYSVDGNYWWTVMLAKPKTINAFWIRVGPYSARYTGEYALWVGAGTKDAAPGTAADPGPGGAQGGLTSTRSENSQPITVSDQKIYYADLTDTVGHFYKVLLN